MGALVSLIAGFIGKTVGSAAQTPAASIVVNGVAMVTALTPVFLWLMKYDDTAAVIFNLPPWFNVSFTWGQFSFILLVVAGVLKMAHWGQSPVKVE